MTKKAASPLFSVIMPVYNGAAHIGQTIENVLQQTQKSFELLVIDDGSTDGTCEIIRNYAGQDERIKFYSQRNSGASAARNHGLRLAQGHYLSIIDADDLWPNDRLDTQYALLKEDDNRIVIGGVKRFTISSHGSHEWGRETVLTPNNLVGKEYVKYILSIPADHMVLFNTFSAKRSLIEQHGGWDESLVSAEDWEHWLRLAQHVQFIHVNAALQYYRKFEGSLTSTAKKTVPLRNHLKIISKVAQRLPLTYWQQRHYRGYRFKEAIRNFLYGDDYLLACTTLCKAALSSNIILETTFYRLSFQCFRGVILSVFKKAKKNEPI